MEQIVLSRSYLFSRQNRINRRNTTEIPVFPLGSIIIVQQMYMYYLCHILIFYFCKYTKYSLFGRKQKDNNSF